MPTEAKLIIRGRPVHSKERVAEMRAQISGHAMRLFQQDGYEAISMRRLAQEAGCTVMTLYKYYERKVDILRDLWGQVFENLFDSLIPIAAAHSDHAARLEAMALGYVRFWLEHREHYFMVFMSSSVSQTDVSVFVENDALLARFQIFANGIARASECELTDAELKLRADLLLCALNGISHSLITISGYQWSSPQRLVHATVGGVLAWDE